MQDLQCGRKLSF